MAFVDDLKNTTGRATSGPDGHKPFVELLREVSRESKRHSADPWRLRLERVRGEVGYDGIERITSQTLFDQLEVPQRGRHAGACRHLASLMRELGWTSMKTRSLAQSGFRDQVRGYARDTRAHARLCG
jgi:hypothetical protein